MLEPTTLPIAISVFPLMLANRLTINSGEDVPNDTMVSPITMLEMLYFLAIAAEPSTNRSAPFINNTNPIANRK